MFEARAESCTLCNIGAGLFTASFAAMHMVYNDFNIKLFGLSSASMFFSVM